jgi:hypothetical protein
MHERLPDLLIAGLLILSILLTAGISLVSSCLR